MKRILSLFVVVFSISVFPQSEIKICTNVYYVWSHWKTFGGMGIYGNYGQISLYDPERHPSEFVWRMTIKDFNMPKKSKDWLEFTGTLEYYITDEFPDAKSQFLYSKQGFIISPWMHDVSKGDMPCIKKTSKARIKIAPYRKHPKVYNIWFEDVGFAFDLNGSHF